MYIHTKTTTRMFYMQSNLKVGIKREGSVTMRICVFLVSTFCTYLHALLLPNHTPKHPEILFHYSMCRVTIQVNFTIQVFLLRLKKNQRVDPLNSMYLLESSVRARLTVCRSRHGSATRFREQPVWRVRETF